MTTPSLLSSFAYSTARFFSSTLGRFIIPMTMVWAGLGLLFINHLWGFGSENVSAGLVITGSSLLFTLLFFPPIKGVKEYKWLIPVAKRLSLPGS